MKPPPHNLEAERAVLGSILLDDRSLKEARSILEPTDFFLEKNQILYQAMLEIDGPIDIQTLYDKLKVKGKENKLKSVSELSQLVNDTITSANIEYYAIIVAENATRRRIQFAGTSIFHSVYKDKELGEIKTEALAQLKEAIINEKVSGLAVSASEYSSEATEMAISLEPVQGIVRTRMGKLDSEYGGLYPGIPYLLAARTSMGKSVTALNIIIEACLSGKRIVLFTFEESKRIVIWRMLSRLAQVPLARIFKRNLTNEERKELRKASDIIKIFNLLIVDQVISSQRICDFCEQENDTKKVDLVVIDLLSKVKEDPKLFGYQKVTLTSNTISHLPSQIDAPVLALHQINRKVEEGTGDMMPMLSHLRDAGTLEEDFKTIMFLLRPYYYDKEKDPNEMAMAIKKNANGPTGNLRLWCDLPKMTVKALAEEGEY